MATRVVSIQLAGERGPHNYDVLTVAATVKLGGDDEAAWEIERDAYLSPLGIKTAVLVSDGFQTLFHQD